MANVLFKYGTPSQYAGLGSYDENSLYFIQESGAAEGVLYKGATRYSPEKQIEFVESVPGTLDDGKIYVVNDGSSVTIVTKGTDGSAETIGGGTLQPGSITDIGAFDESVLVKSDNLTSGQLPDNDTTIPTSGAVKDAIETAIQGVTDDITALGDPVTGASAQRNGTNNGTVITLTRASGTNPITVNVSDLFLTSAEYDSASHTLKLYVQGVSDPVEVDLAQLIPQAVTTEDVAISQPITMTVDVGNLKAGTELITSGEPTEGQMLITDMQDLLQKMFSEDINPTITQPSASITLTGAGAKEVGTQFTPSYSVGFNPGSYVIHYGDNKTKTQATEVTATSYSVTDTNSGSSTTQTGSFTAFTVEDNTNYRVNVTVQHSAGVVPETFLGSTYPDGQIKAGSKTAQSSAVTGFRKGFYGTLTDKSGAINSALVRSLPQSTTSAPANGNTWSLSVPVGALRVMFAYPATLRDVTSVKDVNGLNAEIKSGFAMSTVNVEGLNGYSAISYKVYVMDYAEPNDTANTYTVQI